MELNLPLPYKIINTIDGKFEFQTDNKLIYSVYFQSAKEHFFTLAPDLPNEVYLFGFTIKTGNELSLKYDKRVEVTIIQILFTFFEVNTRAMLFVCDTKDQKQRHRKITFNKWFNKHNSKMLFEKKDISIIIDNDNQYYISLILHSLNPNKEKYLLAFSNLANELDK